VGSVSPVFSSIDIRDAVGQLADGGSIDPKLVPFVRAAVAGQCPTSDRGEQEFVVDVSGCGLFNVDTEELIWPQNPGDETGDSYVLLRILTDRELWEQARSRWDEGHPREWTAFVWRVAVPLSYRGLGFRAAWW
jgi:hypothetical protein